MSAPSIEVKDVSKIYRVYSKPSDRLKTLFGGGVPFERTSLSHVDLTVDRGEVVGIIGANGAGKSTLLKIIADRLEPTTGKATVRGSIAAILELGTGFHPDFTGRENVYMGGMCLGLSRKDVDRKIDDIIGFSELEEVIDLPFKTYSSGMKGRLTFATAVAVDPDVLIIDEALSVGDNRFQIKSFEKIRAFKKRGKTILLVSHSMESVTSFCDRAILLHQGEKLADGDPATVTNIYHHLLFGDLTAEQIKTSGGDAIQRLIKKAPSETSEEDGEAGVDDAGGEKADRPQRPFLLANPDVAPPMSYDPAAWALEESRGYRYGNRKAEIAGLTVLDRDGEGPVRQLVSGQPYQFVMDIIVREDIPRLEAGFLIRTQRADTLFGIDSRLGEPARGDLLDDVKKGDRLRFVLKIDVLLAGGTYFLTGGLAEPDETKCDLWFDAYELKIAATPQIFTTSVINLNSDFNVFEIRSGAEQGAA